ncbi:MAG: hypothetical protein M1826_006135, partial [Phylliscum demangeonii]
MGSSFSHEFHNQFPSTRPDCLAPLTLASVQIFLRWLVRTVPGQLDKKCNVSTAQKWIQVLCRFGRERMGSVLDATSLKQIHMFVRTRLPSLEGLSTRGREKT